MLLSQRSFEYPSEFTFSVENDKFGCGTYNKIKLINIDGKYAILRSPIKNNKSEAFISSQAVSFYHTKLFSEIVKQNVFPNFPILIKGVNKKYVNSTILEYADQNSFNYCLKTLSSFNLDKILVQTLFTLYYMNNVLKLSHNDLSISNLLVKTIKKQKLTYCAHANKYFTIDTEFLAIVSDFDKTFGNQQEYDNMYILEHYTNSKNPLINKIYTHFEQNRTKDPTRFDIAILFSTIFIRNRCKKYRKFINDYLFKNKGFFWCIEKYFSHVIRITNTSPKHDNIFNLYMNTFDYTSLNYENNKTLYQQMIFNEEVRGKFLNHYFIKEFSMNRFLDPLMSIEERCKEITILNGTINNKMRKILIDWLIDVNNSLKLNKNVLISAITLADFVLNNSDINKQTYQLLGIVCLYLFVHADMKMITFDYMTYVCKDAYSIRQIRTMIDNICDVLNLNR